MSSVTMGCEKGTEHSIDLTLSSKITVLISVDIDGLLSQKRCVWSAELSGKISTTEQPPASKKMTGRKFMYTWAKY